MATTTAGTSKGTTFTMFDHSEPLRTGTWTYEEEVYLELLVNEFRNGSLEIEDDTSLRTYLGQMLHCHVKRISKKMEGHKYGGRKKFKAKSFSEAIMKEKRKKVAAARAEFLKSLKELKEAEEAQDEESRKRKLAVIRNKKTTEAGRAERSASDSEDQLTSRPAAVVEPAPPDSVAAAPVPEAPVAQAPAMPNAALNDVVAALRRMVEANTHANVSPVAAPFEPTVSAVHMNANGMMDSSRRRYTPVPGAGFAGPPTNAVGGTSLLSGLFNNSNSLNGTSSSPILPGAGFAGPSPNEVGTSLLSGLLNRNNLDSTTSISTILGLAALNQQLRVNNQEQQRADSNLSEIQRLLIHQIAARLLRPAGAGALPTQEPASKRPRFN